MRIFKSKSFAKFAQKENISDRKLFEVVKDAEDGKIDADYGGGVIKQRISRPNGGKSGGYRTIILYRQKDKAFFVYGFAKKNQENINKEEELYFKKLAKDNLFLRNVDISKLINDGIYEEIFL